MSRPNAQIQEQLIAARRQAAEFVSIFYTYSMLFATVASAGVSTAQMQIQADSNFMITQMTFLALDTVTGQGVATVAGATVQLTDTGSGSTLFDRALPLTSMFGTGQLPFILPVEKILTANSVLSGSLTAGITANATSYYLLFQGAKLYNNQNQR